MTSAETGEDRLAAFLGETPPARTSDLFVAEVMEAVERRAFFDRLVLGGAGALAVAAILWACSPVLNLAVDALAPTLLPVGGMLALTVTLALALRNGRLLPGA